MIRYAFKVTDADGLSFSKSMKDGNRLSYEIGKTVSLHGCVKDGKECGHGIHLAPTLHQTLKWSNDTAFSGARYFYCSYETRHILGEGDDKVRVSKCKVLREVTLDELELPEAKRVLGVIRHVQKLNDKKYYTYDEAKIVSHTLEYCHRLTALDQEARNIDITAIRLHGLGHWDSVRTSVWDSVRASVWTSVWTSVWDSVWDSVRASVWTSVWTSVRASVWTSVRASVLGSVWDSVWDSVRASVWTSVLGSVQNSVVTDDDKNSGLPGLDCILEGGGFFYGVDKKGIAHVIVPAMRGHKDVVL